jgi:hypothetical protein
MFKALKGGAEAITVHVGPGKIEGTEAEYLLSSPYELIKLIKLLY